MGLIMGMGFAINVLNLQLQGFNINIFKVHKILCDRNYIHCNKLRIKNLEF